MLLSRPPRERTLREAIGEGRLGLPLSLLIVTGREDEICDWRLATHYSEALMASVSVLDRESHMIAPAKVSRVVSQFLTTSTASEGI